MMTVLRSAYLFTSLVPTTLLGGPLDKAGTSAPWNGEPAGKLNWQCCDPPQRVAPQRVLRRNVFSKPSLPQRGPPLESWSPWCQGFFFVQTILEIKQSSDLACL